MPAALTLRNQEEAPPRTNHRPNVESLRAKAHRRSHTRRSARSRSHESSQATARIPARFSLSLPVRSPRTTSRAYKSHTSTAVCALGGAGGRHCSGPQSRPRGPCDSCIRFVTAGHSTVHMYSHATKLKRLAKHARRTRARGARPQSISPRPARRRHPGSTNRAGTRAASARISCFICVSPLQ